MPRITGALLARVLTAVALAGSALLAAAPGAAAEETRPNLRSPFTCGERWYSRTYAGHPTFAVDWNLPGSGEADFGQPVFAGGAGLAHVKQHAGYGNMVVVDHGEGWQTLYAHLSSFAVADGQWVTTDTMVGRVGNTGRSDGSHLHHEQLHNGVRQRVVLDGVAITPSFSSRAASYESGNCAAPAVTAVPAAVVDPIDTSGVACGRPATTWWRVRCGLT